MRTWDNRQLLAYLDRVEPVLDCLDHFELLDVDADADAAAIQAAFHAVAATLHPDRHRDLSVRDRERLTIVYARIAEAYRVLRDPATRDQYLREEARKRQAAADRPRRDTEGLELLSPMAQKHYRRARAALATGDRASAILNLRMALSHNPQSSLLRDALREAGG